MEQRLPGYTWRTIKTEVLDRAAKPQEGHKGPPGYYAVTVWGTFFPWSLLLPATAVSAWRRRRLPPVRFAIASVLGPWVMFEIVQTKLMHYFLPALPGLAFLTADMLVIAARLRAFGERGFLRVVAGWGVLVVGLSLLPWVGAVMFGGRSFVTLAAMILLPIAAFEYVRQVYVHFRARRPLDAAAAMGIGMFVLIILLSGLYLPKAQFLRVPNRVADVLLREGATLRGDAIMIDYKETSVAFYQGGTIRPQPDNDFLVRTPSIEWPKWVVISDAVWRRMPPDVQNKLEVIETVHGLNYAGKDADRHHVIDVHVLRRRPGALSLP